ncbi:MAG: AAA family ATPase, partial [Ferrovibrionaceae bacterium]
GQAVIADAVHARPDERAALADLAAAAGVPFTGFWLEAPVDVLTRRLDARRDDASDADAKVLHQQLDYDLGEIGWTRLVSGGDAATTLAAARAGL